MATAPYGIRLLVGAAVTALEETRRLPQTLVMYPMTIVSQVAHLVMKMQQDVADLVIKGDETLESLFPPKDEQPEWVTFDEDNDDDAFANDAGLDDDDDSPHNGERLTEGRFALYSTGGPDIRDEEPAPREAAAAPDVVAEMNYDNLTLAQLRARLPQLRIPDLEALLAYEGSTKSRAPFQTLLANRITRATAK